MSLISSLTNSEASQLAFERFELTSILRHVASVENAGLLRLSMQVDGKLLERGDHPCYREGRDPRLYIRSSSVKDEGVFVPLRDREGQVMLRADHYREIRLTEPWKVPLLFGSLPAPPKADSDDEQKGYYAMFCMLLLRPWRNISLAVRSWIGSPDQLRERKCSAWTALYDAYVRCAV